MRILHPTDFSKTAEKARTVARALARRSGGSLHLVHAQERFEDAHAATGPTRETVDPNAVRRVEADRATETRRLQERLRNLADDGATWDLRWGHPVRELLDASQDHDLIIMGAHGANRLDAYFLGGIAGRLVRRVKVPVLTVRDEAETTDVRRVLLATDFGDASRHAWSLLKSWTAFGIEPVVAHVIDDPRFHADADYARRAADAMSALGEDLDAPPRQVLREGDPIRLLPKIAVEVGADAICVGVRRHAGALGLLLGSRADALLRSSPVPILSVPHVDDGATVGV
ncbi:MAG: universal stress protein [Trueperaceae bacterium]